MLTLNQNKKGTDYLVGDLHGCYQDLVNAMKTVGFNYHHDRLISCGDLIDRGPDSLECLRLLRHPWFFSIMGNHEDMMIKAIRNKGRYRKIWVKYGGGWYYRQSYLQRKECQSLLCNYIQHLPLTITLHTSHHKVGIVHASSPDNWDTVDNVDHLKLLWSRKRIMAYPDRLVAGVDLVIMGHTIINKPNLIGNSLYIDTGAYKHHEDPSSNHSLTLLSVDEALSLLNIGSHQAPEIYNRIPDVLRMLGVNLFLR